MANSLLSYLYPRIKGSQEDVATLTLCHIISQSKALRSRFTRLLADRLHLIIPIPLNYGTQMMGAEKERPDIVGIDLDGNETIICEAKFFASLTANQPNGYLKRLFGGSNCGLIFICPQSRMVGLWNRILSLADIHSPQPVSDMCVDVSGVRMGIICWNEILDTLLQTAEERDPGMIGDIQQLIGFCHEIESCEFIPFKEEDLGANIAIRMDGFYMVVDRITDLLLKQDVYTASKKGLHATPQYNGYTQYIRVDDFALGIFFDRFLWKKQTSIITPFWLNLKNKDWKEDEAIRNYIRSLPSTATERNAKGAVFIALETPTGCTLDETAQYMSDQIMGHVTAAKAICLERQSKHD